MFLVRHEPKKAVENTPLGVILDLDVEDFPLKLHGGIVLQI